MLDLTGFISIIFVIILTIILAYRFQSISKILYTALIVRVLLMLLGNYVITLPDSTSDALAFEARAWAMSQDTLSNIIKIYKPTGSGFYVWFISILYNLFGRSVLMIESMSLLFGMGSVFLGWKIAKILYNEKIAIKVAWLIALFPTLILYSVLILREVYIYFFLLLAIYGVVSWTKNNSIKFFFYAILGFGIATLFHGAMAIGGIVFLFILIFKNFFFTTLLERKFELQVIVCVFFTLIFFLLYFGNYIPIPKLGYFWDTIHSQKVFLNMERSMRGDASYPDWIIIKSNIEFFYKTPFRILYFLFSPFPWNVTKFIHLIGLLDSFLYLTITYYIYCNRKVILKNPALLYILVILIFYIAIFSLGVGNFGTVVRHRAKFIIMLILLAAPSIPNIILLVKKIKIKNSEK